MKEYIKAVECFVVASLKAANKHCSFYHRNKWNNDDMNVFKETNKWFQTRLKEGKHGNYKEKNTEENN